jgi:hypothetical protein
MATDEQIEIGESLPWEIEALTNETAGDPPIEITFSIEALRREQEAMMRRMSAHCFRDDPVLECRFDYAKIAPSVDDMLMRLATEK